MALPLLVQRGLVLGVHLNRASVARHLHSKRQWHQIENIVFYDSAEAQLTALKTRKKVSVQEAELKKQHVAMDNECAAGHGGKLMPGTTCKL